MKLHFIMLLVMALMSACTAREDMGNTTSLSKEELSTLDSIEIDFQFRGMCYAFSSNEYAEPSHGEAHSPNVAQPVNDKFPRKGLYLHINDKELIEFDSGYVGCKLYLVNTSWRKRTFNAQDSRLDIVAEALDSNNDWVPISYLPLSWCGNSYHEITLGRNEYWSFDVPIFKGIIKTRMRYTLHLNKFQEIHSNEVIAYLNKGQFETENKQGHTPRDIMDPYNE